MGKKPETLREQLDRLIGMIELCQTHARAEQARWVRPGVETAYTAPALAATIEAEYASRFDKLAARAEQIRALIGG